MGLDYLNKKVWHPGSMKNIQKVWDVQQEQLQIIKKQKERAKKLLDEQHNEQMKRIQVEAGLIPRSHLQRMDWMYDWGNKLQQQKNNEEFLTGQKKASKKENKHILQEEATNRKCEDFILLHQDPLFAIQREQMRARQSVMENPIEMRSIIREVEEDYLKMHPQKAEKKEKKHKKEKKSKKEKKKKHKRESSNENQKQVEKKQKKRKRNHSSSSSSSSSCSSSSSRSRSRDKKKKSHQSKLYQDYMKKQFGGILKRDEDGKLVPDYGMYKKKYRTQMQQDEDERRRRLQKMRDNAKKIRSERQNYSQSQSQDRDRNRHGDYEAGLAKIRKDAFKVASQKVHRGRYRSPS